MLDQVLQRFESSCFLYDKQKHKNDIIIFSRCRRISLNGAACNPAPMGKEIGLVLNFEARGLLDQVIC
jgi:hypothetical protein